MGPETRYALSEGIHIAYQLVGDGPFDLVFVPGFVTHIELQWRLPGFAQFLTDLGSFSRLIRFDKRGTGMSDPVSGAPSLETRICRCSRRLPGTSCSNAPTRQRSSAGICGTSSGTAF